LVSVVVLYEAGPLQLYETIEPVPVAPLAVSDTSVPTHNTSLAAVTLVSDGRAFTVTSGLVVAILLVQPVPVYVTDTEYSPDEAVETVRLADAPVVVVLKELGPAQLYDTNVLPPLADVALSVSVAPVHNVADEAEIPPIVGNTLTVTGTVTSALVQPAPV
jgi:hypothetical protein